MKTVLIVIGVIVLLAGGIVLGILKRTILVKQPELKGLLIDPSIPSSWDGYKIEREYRGFKLKIDVRNPKHLQHGVKEFIINGNKYSVDGKAYIREDMLQKGLNRITVIL